MKNLMRNLVGCAAVLLVGCGTKTVDPCAGVKGTCLAVQVQGSSGISQVDSLSVLVNSYPAKVFQQAGDKPASLPVALALIFDNLTSPTTNVEVTGSLHGAVVGKGEGTVTLAANQHETIRVTLMATVAGDMAVGDMRVADMNGGVDEGMRDDLGTVPDMAQTYTPARLIAPLSTSTVTQQQPTLHWQLGNAPGIPTIDLCTNRSCMSVIETAPVTGANPTNFVPLASLFLVGCFGGCAPCRQGSRPLRVLRGSFGCLGKASPGRSTAVTALPLISMVMVTRTC